MKISIKSLLLAGSFFMAACESSHRTARVPVADGLCDFGIAANAKLLLSENSAPVKSTGKALPKNYRSFHASGETAFFKAAKTEPAKFLLNLPSGCKTFPLQLSQTMSPELAAKYPDLVSLKGNSGNTDLRLDWNGTEFRAQIIENGKTWFLEPYSASSTEKYYLLFSKDDAPGVKQPFEQRYSPTNNIQKTQRSNDAVE